MSKTRCAGLVLAEEFTIMVGGRLLRWRSSPGTAASHKGTVLRCFRVKFPVVVITTPRWGIVQTNFHRITTIDRPWRLKQSSTKIYSDYNIVVEVGWKLHTLSNEKRILYAPLISSHTEQRFCRERKFLCLSKTVGHIKILTKHKG